MTKKKVLKLGLVMCNELINQVQMSLKKSILLDGNRIMKQYHLITWVRTAKERVGKQGSNQVKT
jgi:hypothetical protein